jgi:hypothetical protein
MKEMDGCLQKCCDRAAQRCGGGLLASFGCLGVMPALSRDCHTVKCPASFYVKKVGGGLGGARRSGCA